MTTNISFKKKKKKNSRNPKGKTDPLLPVELLHKIIDEVAESPEDLQQCVYVNSTFRDRSQHHLLRELELRVSIPNVRPGRIDFNTWCRNVHSYYHKPGRLEQATPLRHITSIQYGPDNYDEFHEHHELYLSYLTNLNQLILRRAYIGHMPNFKILGSRVRVLFLDNCMMEMDHLLTLLRSFALLEHLKVSHPGFIKPLLEPATEEQAQDPPLPLREVHLISSPSDYKYRDYVEGDKLKDFLSHSGAILTAIQIWSRGVFDLSKMVRLARVHLHVANVSRCIEILRTLSSKELAILYLTIGRSRRPPNGEELRSLDKSLGMLHENMDNKPLRFWTNLDHKFIPDFVKRITITTMDPKSFPTIVE